MARLQPVVSSLSGPSAKLPSSSAAPVLERIAVSPGSSVPDYELIRRIGAGAYGEVWLAQNTFGELRAVKIVWRREFGDDERPFQREFEGIRKFEPISRSHPSQLAILHVGKNEEAGCFYYVMELADDASSIGGSGLVDSWINGPRPAGQNSPTCFLKQSNHPSIHQSGSDSVRRSTDPSIHQSRSDPRHQSADPSIRQLGSGPPHKSTDPPIHQSSSYVPHTLRHDLKLHGRLPVDRVIELGLALTEALGHLHAQGLVHRDVKPSNIVFVKGKPKLADIGLVTESGDARSIVGTEGYLAPDGLGTPRADLYALGKVLYEAATGRDRRDFPDLPLDWETCPERDQLLELNEVLLKACASRPGERFQSAEELAAELALLQRGGSVRRQRSLEYVWSVVKKAGLAGSLLGLIVGTSVLFLHWLSDTDAHSAVPEVDNLVAQGNICILSETPERRVQGIKFFKEAIRKDPTFVPARLGLFNAYPVFSAEGRAVARELAQVAPSMAEAHYAAACVKWWDWKFRDALAEARAATKMRAASRADLGWVHCLVGWFLLETGHPEEALVEYRIAERLLPANPTIESHLGHPYFVQRKFPQALEHYTNSLALMPTHLLCHRMMGQVYEATGDFMKAIDEHEAAELPDAEDKEGVKRYWEELRAKAQTGGKQAYYQSQVESELASSEPNSYWIATYYAALGKRPSAYQWLEQAALKEHRNEIIDDFMVNLCWDHNDTQFQAIARKVGLMK